MDICVVVWLYGWVRNVINKIFVFWIIFVICMVIVLWLILILVVFVKGVGLVYIVIL